MRGLSSMVWTPKGMGRVVERKRGSGVRVELLAQEGAMQDYELTDIAPFFTNIDLKKTQSVGDKSKLQSLVTFEIAMSANYAI